MEHLTPKERAELDAAASSATPIPAVDVSRWPSFVVRLREDLPRIAERLATQMADEALVLMVEADLDIEHMSPTVSIEFARTDGGRDFRVSLSIEAVDAEVAG
ncbi:hypothetical protein [Roseomonas xinghualingensis]|uniref:hypothetical protein n=1 Tax=Roseomonas xinghualingensis TaxID=2986475 RepID=UPI0021F1C7A6|nr:hypothetical protein [Roseomonas sp. SXEYE001]MCV4206884.1 hypothetical protein [Roseomonas sp. SXEYE001]